MNAYGGILDAGHLGTAEERDIDGMRNFCSWYASAEIRHTTPAGMRAATVTRLGASSSGSDASRYTPGLSCVMVPASLSVGLRRLSPAVSASDERGTPPRLRKMLMSLPQLATNVGDLVQNVAQDRRTF